MRTLGLALCQLLAATTIASADPGEVMSGHVIALDGGTLMIDGQPLRMFGIEVPDMAEADGWYARAALDEMIVAAAGSITCTVLDTDGHGRPVGVCSALSDDGACELPRDDPASGGSLVRILDHHCDLGAAMILAGWAAPWRSDTYAGVPYGGDVVIDCTNLETLAEEATVGCLGVVYDMMEFVARQNRHGRWHRWPQD